MVKNRRKNGDYYWVMANVTPVIQAGKAIGYMSVRTKPSREQVAAATKLYASEKANPGSLKLRQGRVVRPGPLGKVGALIEISLGARIAMTMSFLLAATGLLAWEAQAPETFKAMGLDVWATPLTALTVTAVAWFWYFLATQVVGPLKVAVRSAQIMAGGDLTGVIETTRTDEIGQLMRAMRQLNTNLHSIIGDLRNNFENMMSSTRQLASGNQDLSGRTDSQAAALEETAASMEELTSTVKQNADHSKRADDVAKQALGSAEKGGVIVTKVVVTIAEISESSNKIADIVGIINGIAYQTNLLALNAAVEAARAGNAGLGFAVVATEVRSLAQRSAEAAAQIKQLIEVSVKKVDAGTVLARDAGVAMQEILAAVNRVTGIMTEISSASFEQSGGIGQVNDTVMQMDTMTQQNAALVEEAAHATDGLAAQGTKLMQALAVFKLGKHEGAPPKAAAPSRQAGKKITRRAA